MNETLTASDHGVGCTTQEAMRLFFHPDIPDSQGFDYPPEYGILSTAVNTIVLFSGGMSIVQ